MSGPAINSACPYFLPVTFPQEMLSRCCGRAQLTYPEVSATHLLLPSGEETPRE